MVYKCKRCGKFVAKDATVCKHCGLENPAEEVLACNTPKNYAVEKRHKICNLSSLQNFSYSTSIIIQRRIFDM